MTASTRAATPATASPLANGPSPQSRTHNVPAVLDRLDPDSLHPGRIAGPYAWAAWNLTTHVPHHELTIVVARREEPTARPELLSRLELLLQVPVWRNPDEPACTRHDSSVTVHLAGGPCQIRVTSHDWYLPSTGAARPGPVVDQRGFPLIDEHTAVRERFEQVLAHRPTNHDVTDLVHWIGSHRTHTGRAPRLEMLLQRLHRDAPHTRQTIDDIVEHARRHYPELRNTPGLDTAMQTLADVAAPHRRPRFRTR